MESGSGIGGYFRSALVLAALVMLGFVGCDPPEVVVEDVPEPVVKKRDIPLPGIPGLPEYQKLVSVSEPGVTDAELASWTKFNSVIGKLPIDPKPELLEEIRNTAVVLNALPYAWNEELRQAIRESKNLKWLRVGAQFRTGDLAWISELKELRGLSFNGSNLGEEDFQLLAGLPELRYLGFTDVILPSAVDYPPLPKLEFLAIDGKFVTNSHLPVGARMPNVAVFTATWSQITDEKLAELIQAWPNLRYMFLARCEKISAKSAPEIAKLKHLRYLQVGFTGLSKELYDEDYMTVPELQLQLPDCHMGFGK